MAGISQVQLLHFIDRANKDREGEQFTSLSYINLERQILDWNPCLPIPNSVLFSPYNINIQQFLHIHQFINHSLPGFHCGLRELNMIIFVSVMPRYMLHNSNNKKL